MIKISEFERYTEAEVFSPSLRNSGHTAQHVSATIRTSTTISTNTDPKRSCQALKFEPVFKRFIAEGYGYYRDSQHVRPIFQCFLEIRVLRRRLLKDPKDIFSGGHLRNWEWMPILKTFRRQQPLPVLSVDVKCVATSNFIPRCGVAPQYCEGAKFAHHFLKK